MAPIIHRTPEPAEPDSDSGSGPRLVIYYQTTHSKDGQPISMLRLMQPGINVTHIIIGAVHLHADDPSRIHINNLPPSSPLYETMWDEKKKLQEQGIKFLCMLGGAAPGSYSEDTLGASDAATFRIYYEPLRDMIRAWNFEGIDLDVEEEMSPDSIARLIDALREDFGKDLIITLTPVATALMGLPHLSGFNYADLEVKKGSSINWYNTQFYNGWGEVDTLDAILAQGWDPRKLVVGVLTNHANGSTNPPFLSDLKATITATSETHGRIGGIFGWEYFNSLPGGTGEPWLWARQATELLGLSTRPVAIDDDGGDDDDGDGAPAPRNFEYDSDGVKDGE